MKGRGVSVEGKKMIQGEIMHTIRDHDELILVFDRAFCKNKDPSRLKKILKRDYLGRFMLASVALAGRRECKG